MRRVPPRMGWAVLALVVVFLTLGVPRRFAGDAPRDGSPATANFARLCRDHGGTPAPAPAERCTVRYGGRVYVMDAITPRGFDEDTARFQRRGCEEARRRQRRPFVYHADTGVCERPP